MYCNVSVKIMSVENNYIFNLISIPEALNCVTMCLFFGVMSNWQLFIATN